jgi:hypothetical protein
MITCYTSLQIYKKIGSWEVFVSSVQTELSQFPNEFSSRFLFKQLAIFEMSYLLKSWEIDCAC